MLGIQGRRDPFSPETAFFPPSHHALPFFLPLCWALGVPQGVDTAQDLRELAV